MSWNYVIWLVFPISCDTLQIWPFLFMQKGDHARLVQAVDGNQDLFGVDNDIATHKQIHNMTYMVSCFEGKC